MILGLLVGVGIGIREETEIVGFSIDWKFLYRCWPLFVSSDVAAWTSTGVLKPIVSNMICRCAFRWNNILWCPSPWNRDHLGACVFKHSPWNVHSSIVVIVEVDGFINTVVDVAIICVYRFKKCIFFLSCSLVSRTYTGQPNTCARARILSCDFDRDHSSLGVIPDSIFGRLLKTQTA